MEQTQGLLRIVNNSDMVKQEQAKAIADAAARDAQKQKDELLTGLAGFIMPLWDDAKRAKNEVRQRLIANLHQRRGEYEPDKLTAIRKTGGSEIYMMITSVKCRAAGSWLRDALLGSGHDKPWTISPTPNPDLPSDAEEELLRSIGEEVGQMAAVTGQPPPPAMVRERIDAARDTLKEKLRETARLKAEGTERILEDQMVEGGYDDAMNDFVDDFVTYPAAILKGPVIHSAPVLTWKRQDNPDPGMPGWIPVVETKLVKRWYRVDPFKFYPARWAADIEDGPMFEHHKITKDELHALIGAPGYDEGAIRKVLQDAGNLTHWLGVEWLDSGDRINQPQNVVNSAEGPMDALEFFGSVPGKHLMDWGVKDPEVKDPEKPYNVNVWMIGREVIKASINPDPLGTKPYRKACYEQIPGAFWGNAIPDLVRDVADMCNSAARSLNNNMAMSSGPQVAVNVTRMPAGTQITQIYPWKIHQFESDPMGSTAPPIEFFQPQSNAQELMGVFSYFSLLADEYSGLPKYMSGDGNIGGAGRTASGLSSLMSNSNRLMKQVMSSIDRINTSSLQALHQFLMQYEFDRFPELSGDVKIVARGATSVMAREQLAIRRSEFLAATGNPIDSQIMGQDGRAYLLREQAKGLELDTDRIIGTQPLQPQLGAPGQPGVGAMPGQPGQPGSAPAPMQNNRPVGATMDRPPMPG